MKLPPSTASSGQFSSFFSSDASDEDSVHSFRLFLDLVTPAEFSRLLRTRVRHLLSTWPPGSQSIQDLSTSGSSSRAGHPISPSPESIEAFTAFFRSQDSPPSSPSDESARTSLSAIHHHLLALQTLFSFLSGRELKDIVRARLAEGGKDKLAAVRGLMDILRDPGQDETENAAEEKVSSIEERNIPRNRDGHTAKVGLSTGAIDFVSPSASAPTKLKIPIQSLMDGQSPFLGDDQPPKKRQRVDSSEDSSYLTPMPMSNRNTSAFPSSHVQDLTFRSRTDSDHMIKSEGGSRPSFSHDREPMLRSDTADREDRLRGVRHGDVGINSGFLEDIQSRNNEVREAREGNVDGPVLRQLDDDEPPMSSVSSTRLEIGHIQRRFSLEKGKQPAAGKSEEGEPRLVSPEEQRRLRTAFGILPKNFETSDRPRELDRHAGDDTASKFQTVSGTNENFHDENSPAPWSSGDRFSVSPPPDYRIPRSRSLSFTRSISDRGSPPGPMLRTAVDWASGVSSAPDGGSAFASGAVFDSDQDNDAITGDMFAPKSFMRNQGRPWIEDDDENDMQTSEMETNGEGSASQRRKLFIRLPARPKPRLAGPGVASEGPIASTSTSGGLSPLPEHGTRRSPKTHAPSELRAGGAPSFGKNGLQRPESAPDSSKTASMGASSPNVGSLSRTPGLAAPHPRYPVSYPGSRPQSGSPGTLPPGTYAVPSAYTAQPHPYSWFGAMFYVPFRGHPQPSTTVQNTHKAPAGPSRRASDAARTSTEERDEEPPSASAPTPTSPNPQSSSAQQTGTLRKKFAKRAESEVETGTAPASATEQQQTSPPPPELDPDMTYTDDIGVKETATVKRRCFNCRGIHAPSWRKSKLTFGKILCNKCGIYESTHMMPRPLKTRPRRAQPEGEGSIPPKKRKNPKKLAAMS